MQCRTKLKLQISKRPNVGFAVQTAADLGAQL